MRQKWNRHLQNHDYRGQRQLDLDVQAMTLTPDGVCSECGGDLEPRDGDPNSILGKYQPCVCGKSVGFNNHPEISQPTEDLTTMPETQSTEVATVTANPETFREFDTPLGELTVELTELQARKPDAEGNITVMTVNLFNDWDTRAKQYLETAEQSPQNQTVKKAWAVARDLSAWFKKATEPVESGRKWASDHIFGPYEAQRKARELKEQREREAAIKAQQEADRAAEVANLKALGHTTEAKELKAAPLPPIASPPPKMGVGKVAGRSTKEVWVIPEVNPVSDFKAFYLFIAEHPEYWNHQGLVASKWKTTLTNAKGLLVIPGLRVEKKNETANRG